MAFSEREFQEFHDFTLSCGQPMGTVLVSERVKCRKCDKTLVLEKTSHPGVIYHTYRGTYMGSRLTKHCRTCQIHEHYGQWSIQGQKYFDATTLKLPFLLSTEDTAFDMTLLSECSNLLWIGAVPFSTFATDYRRPTNEADAESETPKTKRRKR